MILVDADRVTALFNYYTTNAAKILDGIISTFNCIRTHSQRRGKSSLSIRGVLVIEICYNTKH